MRIARVATPQGAELVLVDPQAATWQRTGISATPDWITPSRLAMEARPYGPCEQIDMARLLPPLVPRTMIGVGLNYRSHALEQGRALPREPLLFMKNTRSVAAPVGTLPLHAASACLDYEAELGIVIGRDVFGCTRSEAAAAIAGWLIVQDYTLRDMARPESLAIAKGGPAMAPIGPWLTTVAAISVDEASTLAVRCHVNGELRQNATTADMHFGPVDLVHYIARHMPLGPGDVIATGSPSGSGVSFTPPRWLAAGDHVETEITGLGRLHQQVTDPG